MPLKGLMVTLLGLVLAPVKCMDRLGCGRLVVVGLTVFIFTVTVVSVAIKNAFWWCRELAVTGIVPLQGYGNGSWTLLVKCSSEYLLPSVWPSSVETYR